MHLCDEKHGEVCHEDIDCPACHSIGVIQDDLDDMSKERDELQKECERHETDEEKADAQIASLEAEIAALKAR